MHSKIVCIFCGLYYIGSYIYSMDTQRDLPQEIRSDCSVSLTDTTRDNAAILSCDLEKFSDIGARPQPRYQIATGVTKRMYMHDLQQMC